MSDWFGAAVAMQKRMLGAQKTALDSGGHAHAAGEALVQAQEAARRAAEANLAAWQAWLRLWSVGPW